MNSYNDLPVTAEEVEEMDRLCRLGAGVPFVKDSSVTVEGVTMEITQQPSAEILHNQSQLNPEAIIDEMMTQFSIKLKLLLTTLITQTKAQPHADDQSLQACVDAVLEQAGWVGDKIDTAVNDYIDNEVAWSEIVSDPVSSAVDNYFSYEFSLTDHCDIDDIIADKLDDRLEDIVQERLNEMLSTATITFNN